ncbi:MAG: biotin--[acetyl-CoA-carboxylase] ligase [Clostridiales Family XIII bacterium]|jgi:BirA family biotin operon repressor/biotin-[acetyl-CoA-carboxylase] ligase|nr:biotin--[acetyl-CoA-carboxylase] ligase [Clostridiales Family XIII bacterium]
MSSKDSILTLLENSRGRSVSGEYIAHELDISRSAVWKAINELKKSGYKIEAVTNKGYRLREDNDILSVQGMVPFLAAQAVAGNIIFYPSVKSTNRTAKEIALTGAKHGTVVVSDCQTEGRGRYDREFYSPQGSGIYMSFVLRPEQGRFESPTLITAFAGVAVCEAIRAVSAKEPVIKWVNDIYCDGKKICGILTEAVSDFESGNIGWVVVGIGINFSTPDSAFPAELRRTAGALFPAGENTVTRNRLAAEIMNRMLDMDGYDKGLMLEKYRSLLFMLGSGIQVVSADGAYEAVAIDIDDMGRLIVRAGGGETRTLSYGEISIRC